MAPKNTKSKIAENHYCFLPIIKDKMEKNGVINVPTKSKMLQKKLFSIFDWARFLVEKMFLD